jgi:hypothetical protein
MRSLAVARLFPSSEGHIFRAFMGIKTSLLALALLLIGCTHSQKPPVIAEAPDLPDGYFPITPWDLPHWSADNFSDPHHGLASLKNCGFNTACFIRPQHIPEAERLGLRGILAAQRFPIEWRKLSDTQIDAVVQDMVAEAHNSPAVVGYFLADEPGQPDFASLAKAVAAVKKYAPGKLAYINLFPDYATLGAPDISQLGAPTFTDYLEQYIATVHPQFISYDNYQIEYSLDQQNPGVAADYYTNLMEVRRIALKHDLPFWNIVSSNQIRPDMTIPSPANLLLQAYTTLAAGAKGLTWYTYYSTGYLYSPVDADGHLDTTWSYLRMVNDQVAALAPTMNRLHSTGVYFTPPLPLAPSLPKLPGKIIQSATCNTPLMIGEFTTPTAEKYAMIVNLSLRDSARFSIATTAKSISRISPVDASEIPLKGNSLWLTAGQGVLLKLR